MRSASDLPSAARTATSTEGPYAKQVPHGAFVSPDLIRFKRNGGHLATWKLEASRSRAP